MATGMNTKNNEDLKSNALFDVSHVTAVVTGGGSGIGLMITQALVTNGAKVYITGRREEALEKVVEKYSSGPGEIMSLPGDISSKEGVLELVKQVEGSEPNGIQLLVNNAGVALDHNTRLSQNEPPKWDDPASVSKHFLASEMSHWEDTFRTNVFAQYFMSVAFLPLLAKGHQQDMGCTSSIVNVSSISGFMKGTSMGQFAYAASKASFTHLTRMLATTFMQTKVRVNCIAPGIFPSEMTAGGQSDEDQKSHLDPQSGNPSGRKGTDPDMAATILLLAGRGGQFYNHQVLHPDGGATLSQPAAV